MKNLKLFLKYYFSNMPRDKANYKFRWQEAIFYVKWAKEIDKTMKEFYEMS